MTEKSASVDKGKATDSWGPTDELQPGDLFALVLCLSTTRFETYTKRREEDDN